MSVAKKGKIAVALSGGVDSSVAAALLKAQGYECIGVHLKFWNDPFACTSRLASQNKCCTVESMRDAQEVAKKLNIPFYVVNTSDLFKKKIVDYFLKSYAAGLTPNPCVLCNRYIKFGELLKKVKRFGVSGVATGHYARIVKRGGEYQLHAAHDKEKDQSYFLHQLDQKQLAQVVLPLGDLKKEEVYRIAKKFGFNKIAGKKESQGICFFPEATPENFLKRNLKAGLFVGGPIVTVDGREIGLHKGLPLYTIGQRQGLGIGGVKGSPAGEPWYVIKIDRKNNSLVVGRRKDILRNKISITDLHFVSGENPSLRAGAVPKRGRPSLRAGAVPKKNKKINVDVKIRHRALPVKGILELHGKNATIITKKPLSAVTPGQFAVCYVREKVLCGGIIK